MKFELQHVHYMPKELRVGVLFVSEEFETAAHLCACGCGSKIRTPLGPTEWSVMETKNGPSLNPSVGNWQQACQSHYWISNGEVIWAEKWTQEQIIAGRTQEETRRKNYYDKRNSKRESIFRRFWYFVRGIFKF